ncbi:MAG TPA: ATP-binding protein [Thermoplasmata archaeon]|nr:ATP-binding protein [Thermoplasmata archaeon]
MVLIQGAPGFGKSLLIRTLIPHLRGPKLYVAYLPIPLARPGETEGQDLALLVIDPQAKSIGDGPGAALDPPAGAPGSSETASVPELLQRALLHLKGTERGTVIVDSWDRGSEVSLRALGGDGAQVQILTVPARILGTLRMSLVSSPAHMVIAVTPELGRNLQSTADAMVDLHEITRAGAHLRVVASPKARGSKGPTLPESLYTVDEGEFRVRGEAPRGFRPPVGPADPDPAPDRSSGWPGSAAFADAFGRLRFGGFTGLTLSPDSPDTLPTVFAVPMAVHAIRSGGRVVWIPSPVIRPSRIVGLLKEQLPSDWIRERLRIVSAAGDDPGLDDLRSTILPLQREIGSGNELRTATVSGVGPLFPEAYRFLKTRPETGPALYVMSLEGLRAATTAAGIPLDPTTIPVIFGAYARIPSFHGFGFGSPDDPLAVAVRSGVDTVLHTELVCGRNVVFGVRPQTAPFLLDWSDPRGRYSLVRLP